YRKLMVDDTTLSLEQPDESLLSRIGYDLNLKKGFLVSNTLYELGSVQQQKQEYAFALVPSGQGVYTWIDYNDDSVQQINEFEVAAFQSDANYVKVPLPTNEYVKAYSSLFNQSLLLNVRNIWSTTYGLKGFL